MTRFARAKGSKSCNSKLPEEASKWGDLKPKENKPTSKKQKRKTAPENVSKKPKTLTEEDSKKIEKKKLKKFKQWEKKRKGGNITKSNNEQDEEPGKFVKRKNKSDKKPDRRKPLQHNKMDIGGKEVDIAYFSGFPIKKEDANRLKNLKKEMSSKGLPYSEINRALKLERRKAEKALAREKKKVCFHCRKSGHNLSDCPSLDETSGTGICFKCGSTEHTHFECKVVKNENFKFAQCFICKEQGHISRQCPDNPRGLYPKGGACKLCGDVTHLRRNCTLFSAENQDNNATVGTIDEKNIEDIPEIQNNKQIVPKKQNKIIKF